eukprot:gnl/Chilomastix_cuspidata/3414.p1 GENE.gnl/Chilomastix_cuspidata/3414~~gnl/Chilomastix_cuspidata/3414.p1  ORF type:complete len:287 (-),score=53.29 gnl/Chilomastix_cuspidata/3414:9-869(-)
MSSFADLHCHSTCSDGTLSPIELIDAARKIGLRVLAITDHDNMDSVKTAFDYAQKFDDIRYVPGVELSTRYLGKTMAHILGYFPATGSEPPLQSYFEHMERVRHNRMLRTIEKLQELGYDIDFERVKPYAQGVLGRPHAARYLVDHGHASNVQDVFDRLLGTGKPAYVAIEQIASREAIAMILRDGGLPVLAHPFQSFADASAVRAMLADLAVHGLRGVEAFHTMNSPEDSRVLCGFATELGLAVTGGSDFHKPHDGHGTLGLLDRTDAERFTEAQALQFLALTDK